MNEQKRIIEEIGRKEGFEVFRIFSLAGGSINDVFLLNTDNGKKVLKLNEQARFPGMFQAEKEGLQTIKNTGAIDVPTVISNGGVKQNSYLILEYKQSGSPHYRFWEIFAEQLSQMHRHSAPEYGFDSPNYIGSLPQKNKKTVSASDFFISQRLVPQMELAFQKGFTFGNLDNFYKNVRNAIPEEPPALIHGDLWSGNYLVNEKGRPCLIDPAVCFASREMDLSMMKLFGGFPSHFFTTYHEIFPLQNGFEKRVPLWQLYYLLVHLNIFGSSYYGPVKDIIRKHS